MSKKGNDKSEQLSLFTPVMGEITAAKDQIDLMAYPFFSLSKKKRITPIEYDDGRVRVLVTGQEKHGIANIYDADILIYVASKIMASQNRGAETSRKIRMSKYDILEFVGKGTSGREYKKLTESLERLQSTSISTTIQRENSRFKKRAMFSWINEWKAVEKDGKPMAIEFELSDWLYQGIIEGKVLTLPKGYFRISGGLERFLYKICRKVIGNNNGILKMRLSSIHARSGIVQKPARFQKMVEKIVSDQSIPDYWIFLTEKSITGEVYICGVSKKHYKNQSEAYKNNSFIAFNDLIDGKRV